MSDMIELSRIDGLSKAAGSVVAQEARRTGGQQDAVHDHHRHQRHRWTGAYPRIHPRVPPPPLSAERVGILHFLRTQPAQEKS